MSVQAPSGNRMMRGLETAGSAESGAGVVLTGFYAPNGEVQERLKKIDREQGPFSEIALHESEGWTFFIGASEPLVQNDFPGTWKLGHFRRESHRFFEDLPAWIFQSKAVHVKCLSLSQASGFLSLAWLYSEEPHV